MVFTIIPRFFGIIKSKSLATGTNICYNLIIKKRGGQIMPIRDEEGYLKLINSPIGSLHGVGVKRSDAFMRMGIYTVGDLLLHFPRAYQNRGNVRPLSAAIYGENCSYMLTVGTRPRTAILRNRKTVTKFKAFDESNSVDIVFYNQKYKEDCFRVGETHRFWGKVIKKANQLMMSSPSTELALYVEELPDFTPVYSVNNDISQAFITECISTALSRALACGLPEIVPDELREMLVLPNAEDALRMIHNPRSMQEIEVARRYFSARELYLFSLGLSSTKSKRSTGTPPAMSRVDIKPFTDVLGFPLTGAQKRSINEIYADMVRAETPMSRLLSGDVGSGKTAVAAAAIYIALKNGYQATLMAPTEILASQHFATLEGMLSSLGYRVGLLLGSTTAANKRSLRQRAASGELDLLIGTHALLTEDTVFKKLGLVITDEQHRFGVSQRAGLGRSNSDGCDPHVMVMSATPIPRTLALILYGDLRLSMLDELPPGRQRVDTFVVNESYRARLNAFIGKQVSEGGQVYIVCPAVEQKNDDEDGDLLGFAPDGSAEMIVEKPPIKSAVEHHAALTELFPNLKIGLIHGRLKSKEKEEVMGAFHRGELQILVSTTVIEVGVNVPNASLMIVENADRFGLSQLHQLRGRVGRGTRKAYCVLVSSSKGENALRRLEAMRTTYDGYKIAEYDLEIRGPGDYFPSKDGGARQSGSFSCVMNADMNMLKIAMEIADKVVSSDPELKNGDNRFAREEMKALLHTDERAMQ
jgi:ATP-dependent DNA helicase RecG